MHMNVRQMDLFDVFQGIQFLPLDKYMYLKVHCFVSLIETTFRYVIIMPFLHALLQLSLFITLFCSASCSTHQEYQKNSDAL